MAKNPLNILSPYPDSDTNHLSVGSSHVCTYSGAKTSSQSELWVFELHAAQANRPEVYLSTSPLVRSLVKIAAD